MNALRQSTVNGEPVRRRRRLAAEYDDGLYRYVPVPPVFRDAEGYPLEDGMSQHEKHQKETAYWCDVLERHLPDATVCSDLPMPYMRGDGNRTVVPDLLVALRAPPLDDRTSYRLWENPVPDLAMEMLSPGNWRDDVGPKRRTYEHLGVREYWLFDRGGRRLSAPLVGCRLRGRRYRRIAANAAGRLPSAVLGLGTACARRPGAVPQSGDGRGLADLRRGGGRPSSSRTTYDGRARRPTGGRTACRSRARRPTGGRAPGRRRRARAGPLAASEGLAVELAASRLCTWALFQLQLPGRQQP